MIDINKNGKIDRQDTEAIISLSLIAVSIIMMLLGFFLPTTSVGIIDTSVLQLVSIIFAFVGSVLGLNIAYGSKYRADIEDIKKTLEQQKQTKEAE